MSLVFGSMQSHEHHCSGFSCPFLVDTGEALVCSKSGAVVGDIMLANFDYLRASTSFNTRPENTSTSIINTHRTGPPRQTKNEETFTEDFYGDCFRVTQKLLPLVDDASRDKIARRCADCCGMCCAKKNREKCKIKTEYICLASLYLIKEGLVVKGTVICEKSDCLEKYLPKLNKLKVYGYDKGKFTKASRYLLEAIDEKMLSKTLHNLSF